MTATIIRGNALDLPLADASVDLVVTSPPYWSLRSYQDAGQHYNGQLGSEATAGDFIDNLIAATAEFMRVLKPTGSAFVNLGDKYGPNKSLMLIPERYRIACIDRLGLIARSVIVWGKPNGLPESVTDRVRRSHEDWVHLTKEPRYYSAVDEIREEAASNYHDRPQFKRAMELFKGAGFTDKHMAAVRAVGVIDSKAGQVRSGGSWSSESGRLAAEVQSVLGSYYRELCGNNVEGNPLGKLPGSVWTIPTQPLKVPPELGIDHFAAFPMEWPRRIIAGWSPAGVCTACGQGRRPVVLRGAPVPADLGSHRNGKVTIERGDGASINNIAGRERNAWRDANPHTISGYACDCAVPTVQVELVNRDRRTGELVTHVVERPVENWVNPAPTTPGVVLDPFGGTGTTALVADVMGRRGISVDMSADYCRLAAWRTNDPKQRERAARGPKPAAKPKPPEKLAEVEFIHPDQLDLFEDGAA